MQDSSMSRWLSPLMAFCLSFILIAGLAPGLGLAVDRQIDFWLIWFGTMFILALPVLYLEIALAKRSKTTALNALPSLTRDADVSPRWRAIGWLVCAFIPFLAGGVVSNVSQLVFPLAQLPVTSPILSIAAIIIALGLSFAPRIVLVAVLAISVIASLLLSNLIGTHVTDWQMTPVEFKEWGNATILALVASGLGLGLYWQSSLAQAQQQTSASHTVYPIWIAQLLAVVAFGYFSVDAQLPALSLFVAVIIAAALMLQLAKEQMQHRQVAAVIQYAVLVVALALWLIPNIENILNPLLMLLGLVICLAYAIFVGWLMKISHLRKAMNFQNEVFYNVWRIAIRIILPVSIVIAMIAFIGQLI